MNNLPVLICDTIRKDYTTGIGALSVLQGASFTLNAGEMTALVGPSGAGKSTLLHICGLLDQPSSGTMTLLGQNVALLGDAARTKLRQKHVGFVYQFHHLLPEFSALENVMLPQLIAGSSIKQATERALHLLDQVGLNARKDHRPAKLSGGEQQRVAICRALANEPRLLIADEPTGNLDPNTGAQIFALFQRLARQEGVTTLMATHNLDLAKTADRIIEMKNGMVETYAA